MDAALVYDGGGEVRIPPGMGVPCPDQLCGTPLENLGELASRICYDSLGYDEQGKRRGRPADQLHEHILVVKNHSVYEHSNFTMRFTKAWNTNDILAACVNRKGVWVEIKPGSGPGFRHPRSVEITANIRSVIEWPRHTTDTNRYSRANWLIGHALRGHLAQLAPTIEGHLPEWEQAETDVYDFTPTETELVPAEELSDDQAWISLWLYGSRGFTHEQVRHRMAMSQRSTRYVDEDGSPYITHPLVAKFLADPAVSNSKRQWAQQLIDNSMVADRATYKVLVEDLQAYGLAAGLDKQTARKQARGAARGYLGNALASEMIYSASISGWKWILSQRKNKLADAEIRQVYSPGLAALKSSRYGDRFSHYETVPSPDGMGTVLAA